MNKPAPTLFFLIYLILAPFLGAQQTAADPDPTRFAKAIADFGEADAENSFSKGGIVFVGSSSIRMLDIPKVFPGLKALNRGFGGSQISDVNHYIEETVLKYEPSLVIMYCGSNDLWARKPALQVMGDFREFCDKLFKCLPKCKLIALASRPSPRRQNIFETEIAFNYLLSLEAQKDKRITYVGDSCDRYFRE
ncbi:MAG: hypothetical protein KJT03_12475, partial [Verrucomicrobiae bacterium]|nr:hypothetical protein [Verrucomicrobiae bacterium]